MKKRAEFKKRYEELSSSGRKKREKLNREHIVEFFSKLDRFKRDRSFAIESYDPSTILTIFQVLVDKSEMIEVLQQFTRQYRQCVSEIDENDIVEAVQTIQVHKILNS